jgi:hypothetical protein
LLRLDFFYVGIKWYGKHSLKKAKKPQRAYRILLKQKLLDNISWLKSYLPEPRKIKRVGLPANMVDGKYRQFLMTYFKKLGMKVIVAEEEPEMQAEGYSPKSEEEAAFLKTNALGLNPAFIESIQNQAQKLRDKVDVVILPYIDDLSIRSGELWQQRVELTKQWLQGLQSTQKTAYLVVELRVESLAKSCSELGLLLNKRLRKSQKAYRYAAPFLPTN